MSREMPLDVIDKKLLNIIQAGFPLDQEPFLTLGLQLGISGREALRRIKALKTRGIVRQIGPVLNARALGYQITLVAMQVPEERLDKAARVLNAHPGVSHSYQRDHPFNLWFTLSLPAKDDMQMELENLGSVIGSKATLNLPALKIFKARGYFDVGGDWLIPDSQVEPSSIFQGNVYLSPLDRKIINELQHDLPLVQKPFDPIASRLSIDVSELIEQCQSLEQRGIMRRFGASISHNSVGLVANAMACWLVPPAMVDAVGKNIAAFPEVSHCYERKTTPLWNYNLFAMLHSYSKEKCQSIAEQIFQQINIDKYVLLFTIKEFKKTRVRYLV